MALYADGLINAGHQGYGFWAAQAAELVALDSITDPALQSGVSTPMGLMAFPGAQITDNFQAIETIGSSRDVSEQPGRREVTLNSRIQIADGTFLLNALRDRTKLDDAAYRLGLPLFTAETGVGSDFGAGGSWANQYVDCLIDSLRIDFREGQPVNAEVQIMAMCELAQTSPQALAIANGDVLMWTHLSWIVDSVDYRSILSETSVQINNGCQRTGIRNIYLDGGGDELAISRTPLKIVPMIEKASVDFGFYDRLPAALNSTADLGTLTMRAEQPGSGAGRNYLQIAIDHNYLNRRNLAQVPANQIMRRTFNFASYGVVITAGQT
jgi:hypothetical protein